MTERFRSEQDYRKSLEQRIATAAQRGGRGLVRERQVLIFERFLARAMSTEMEVVVKGGMALELRTARARSTRDIDLRVMGAPDRFEQGLKEFAQQDGADRLQFRVESHARPDLDAIGMKYPGRRYRVQAQLAGKIYGDPFGVDVAFGEPMLGPPDRIRGRTDLTFAGVETPEFLIYPRSTHIAEKLHAYTVPRPTPNSRVRDLPDLAILATLGPLDATELRSALDQSFAHRASHTLPAILPAAPERWAAPYAELAEANRLSWTDLATVHRAASMFIDRALRGERGTWNPDVWSWYTRGHVNAQDEAFRYESTDVRAPKP